MIDRYFEAAAYAALRHGDQRRKGALCEPYVTHVLDVARRLAAAQPDDGVLIIGGLLHDIVEDTEGTAEEIEARFGGEVAALVLEVSDDKSLPKAERKRLKIAHFPKKSERARRLILADTASNVASLTTSPPDWPLSRIVDYIDWAERVVAPARGLDPVLETGFAESAAAARAQFGDAA